MQIKPDMTLETMGDLEAFLKENHCRMEVGSTCRGTWGAVITFCHGGTLAAMESDDFATAVRGAVTEAVATLESAARDEARAEQEWN